VIWKMNAGRIGQSWNMRNRPRVACRVTISDAGRVRAHHRSQKRRGANVSSEKPNRFTNTLKSAASITKYENTPKDYELAELGVTLA
jgi:hypothetical protein